MTSVRENGRLEMVGAPSVTINLLSSIYYLLNTINRINGILCSVAYTHWSGTKHRHNVLHTHITGFTQVKSPTNW